MKRRMPHIIKKAISIFLPLFALFASIIVGTLVIANAEQVRLYNDKEHHSINLQTTHLVGDVQKASSELLRLTKGKAIRSLWEDNGDYDSTLLADLSQEFLYTSKYTKLYDQIRVLDEYGNEIVRVNFNNGKPSIVPDEQLQNKKGRYYFEDAFKLNQGEIFISPLDLNIERGAIEYPLKPMLRFATPVFDKQNKKRGILLLNYFGSNIIDHFSNHIDKEYGNQCMLVNADGYWLYGPKAEDEWGFMYTEGIQKTFGHAYPEEWREIISKKSGQFETLHGIFTFETIFPLFVEQKSSTGSGLPYTPSLSEIANEEYFWKVVSLIPTDVIYAERNHRYLLAATIQTMLGIILLLGSWFVAKISVSRSQTLDLLRNERDNLNNIFETMEDGVSISNDRYEMEYANTKIINKYGACEGRLCYEYFNERTEICPWCKNSEVFSKKSVHWEWTSSKDQKTFDLIETSLKNPDRSISKLKISRDVSDRKQAEAEKLDLLVKLQQSQKLETVGTMVGGIAHELNNILQSVFLYGGLLQSELSDDDDRHSYTQHMLEGADRAKQIIKQLLVFSRKGKTNYQPQNISSTISGALSFEQVPIPPNISIQQNIDKQAGMVFCDLYQIHQIMVNLCNNAVFSMQAKGGILDVSLKQVEDSISGNKPENGVLELKISDTGHGMNNETLERVFDPFFSTKKIGEGTGLGLSVVYGIVEMLKGQILVFSKLDSGTTFRILLPIADNVIEEIQPQSVQSTIEII